jgi:co-chaperonin GroES (HSP10)
MQLTPELEDVGRRVRVLRDRVLVKPLPYVHPTLLTPGIEIQKGVVIAVGCGRRTRRKVAFNQSSLFAGRTLYFEDGDETGEIIPMQVKPGDVVEFSFRNITVVDFDRVGFPGIGDLAFVWQKAIYSVDPDESLNECLLWQQSAGYDRHGNFMSGSEDWHRA